MDNFTLIAFYCVFLLSLQRGLALKCRLDNQQTVEQFQSILQVCIGRSFGQTLDNSDSDSGENDSDNSSSPFDEDTFNRKNIGRDDGRYPVGSQSFKDQYRGYRKNYESARDKHSFDNNGRHYHFNNMNSSSPGGWYDDNGPTYSDRGSFNWNQSRKIRWNDEMGSSDIENDNNNKRDGACVIQCFFDELNVIDQRGFPEKQSVTRLMTQNIHDPELQDFVKESIAECFRFLNTNVKKEKCSFSQNLVSCLANKGKEKCDDWND